MTTFKIINQKTCRDISLLNQYSLYHITVTCIVVYIPDVILSQNCPQNSEIVYWPLVANATDICANTSVMD